MHLSEIDIQSFKLLNLQADSWDVIESAYLHFSKVSRLEISPVACHPRSGSKKADGNQAVCAWLANDARISQERANEIVNGFPMHVAPRLNQIAMNPCRFLGLASSITRAPDAIVFSTSGMDPLGFKNLHKYAMKEYDGTLVHLDISACEYCCANGKVLKLSGDLSVSAG